ncbi:hypothetical protein AB0L00_24065 [Actinoallomurus sp. NPDC052308]|uniref:hypothetical protein n=1 Tax=Actinoallomurus sp. NPDC052308 TaxID=3155530 RepID=UPI003429080E
MIVRAALAAAALAACTGGSPHPSASGPVPITRTPAPHLTPGPGRWDLVGESGDPIIHFDGRRWLTETVPDRVTDPHVEAIAWLPGTGRALAVVDIPQYEEDNIGFLWMRR